jgi:CRISPR system Cascade subunit CasA
MHARFDPRSEACLTALTTDGEPRNVSLLEALHDADGLACVEGESPGQSVAMIEYLLALIYASGTQPASEDEWCRLVTERLSLCAAADWLRSQSADRWDLFDPDRPLGQNSALRPFLHAHGVGPAQIVIEQAGDYNQFFSHHHLHHPKPLPAPAAFRALLTIHTYGLQGRAMVKTDWLGAQLSYQSVARLGGRIRVLAVGRTLGDTLRLNLMPCPRLPTDRFNHSWNDVPARRNFRDRKRERPPVGLADAHSYLCRSVLMRPVQLPDGSLAVDRVLVGSGEIWPESPSSLYCQDAVLTERRVKQRTEYVVLRPNPDRAMWREAHALYATAATRHRDRELYHRLALVPQVHIRLRAVGLVARQATPTAWLDEEFPYVPGQLEDLSTASRQASAVCEYVAQALYRAADTARAVVYPNAKPSDRTAQRQRFDAAPDMWAGAGRHFHDLLNAIAEKLDTEDSLVAFAGHIARLGADALHRRLDSLPRHGTGQQARHQAKARLWTEYRSKKAPDFLLEANVDPR